MKETRSHAGVPNRDASRLGSPTLCGIAIFAYLLNTLVIASGAVRCDHPEGATTIEIGCDHGHCHAGDAGSGQVEAQASPQALDDARASASPDEHAEGCELCEHCPCEDTPLGVELSQMLTKEQGDVAAATASGVVHLIAPASRGFDLARLTHAPHHRATGPPAATLRELRTIILLI